MIEVLNRQRRVPLKAGDFEEFAEKALAAVKEISEGDVAVVFVSDARIRKLNRDFRGKNSATDVLSFPLEEGATTGYLGDIVVSAETAQRQAAENGLEFETEIRQLVLHGLLHLAGYDHETDNGEMNRLELRLRRKLKIDQ